MRSFPPYVELQQLLEAQPAISIAERSSFAFE